MIGNERAPSPWQPTAEALQTFTSSDVEDLARLFPQLTDKPPTEEMIAQNLLDSLASPTSRIVVVRDEEGRIRACATGTLRLGPVRKKGYVDDVVTDQEFRGYGCATIMMQALHGWFAENGASSVELTSRPEREEARRLYAKLGYHLLKTGVFRARLGVDGSVLEQ